MTDPQPIRLTDLVLAKVDEQIERLEHILRQLQLAGSASIIALVRAWWRVGPPSTR